MERREMFEGSYVGRASQFDLELGFIPDRMEIQYAGDRRFAFWEPAFTAAHLSKFVPGEPFVFTAPTISPGTSDAKKLLVSAFLYNTGAAAASYTATETALTGTTHDIAKGKYAAYLVYISTAGTVAITKSADKDDLAAAVAAIPAIANPEVGIPLGYVIAWSAAGFTAATDVLDPAWLYVAYGVGYRVVSGGITKRVVQDFTGLRIGADPHFNALGLTYTFRAIKYL